MLFEEKPYIGLCQNVVLSEWRCDGFALCRNGVVSEWHMSGNIVVNDKTSGEEQLDSRAGLCSVVHFGEVQGSAVHCRAEQRCTVQCS